ncbi:MAG TPA: TerD family protein [Actinocrinis sp.]|nr:TerD family protein [Actinocrinis sp.]
MIDARIIRRTLRVPAPSGPAGDGAAAARQFDAALLSVGFKASRELLEHLAALDPGAVIDTCVHALDAVRQLVGDHVEHNVYFRDFPSNVPDTVEFWLGLLAKAVARPKGAPGPAAIWLGGVNLLALPGYGTYQHSYAEMLAAHDELMPSVSDRVTVLHLGASLDEEVRAVYADLAGSPTPLAQDELDLLGLLAAWCADAPQPEAIPVRENRAVINRVRLAHGKPLLVDTVTDVLRLAAVLSGGDVSLREPTRLRSFARRDRRALLAALDDVVAANDAKLADVAAYREPWKRLGERLHPHEHPQWPHAAEVFAVARGEKTLQSLAYRVEYAFAGADLEQVIRLLSNAPGLLVRSLDRVARQASAEQAELLCTTLRGVADRVSGRVLLSLREHLDNRTDRDAARIFANGTGRAWVAADGRMPLAPSLVGRLAGIIDAELLRRMPVLGHLVVDPAVYDVAVPLSGKGAAPGFRILPRGSRSPVDGERLRFFVYWKQRAERTDYDLSALLLNADFSTLGWLSFTDLSGYGGAHSGDITEAPEGASEFIDLDLSKVDAAYVVPQVNVYCGEGYDEIEEAFFGYMLRERAAKGRPFEPRAVRMKSDLRGTGRVALPVMFGRGRDGCWSATWTQLFLRGAAWRNQVETNRLSTSLLARSVMERRYLPMRYLIDLLRISAESFSEYGDGLKLDGPVTYVGLERPDDLPDGSEVYALDRLNALVPA